MDIMEISGRFCQIHFEERKGIKEMNEYALPYEEMMQEIFNNPERAYFWRDNIKYVADKVVRDFMKINNVSDLHRLDIKFYILLEDEYASYIVNFHPDDYSIQRVAYNLIDIDRKI
jgi:hypothetical protein